MPENIPVEVVEHRLSEEEQVCPLMVQKFCMGSPLYRQEQEWARQGLKLSRQTVQRYEASKQSPTQEMLLIMKNLF